MNPGQLNRRLVFKDRAEIKGSMGQPKTGEWEERFVAWARVRPLRGTNFFAAQQAGSKVDCEITIRARSGLARGMRAEGAAGVYVVETWRPDETGDYLIIDAITQVG